MLVAALWRCTWGRGRAGAMALAPLSAGFQSLPPLPTIKLGPSGAGSRVGGPVHTLGPCGSLQGTLLWGWEFFLLLPQPPQVFSLRGLRLYFPAWSPGLRGLLRSPPFLRVYLCMNAGPWGLPATTSLGPPAPPLLRVLSAPAACLRPFYRSGWMFLVYLFGCRTSIQFDFLSVLVFFFFLSVIVLLLVVGGGTVCLPTPPSWPEVGMPFS